MKKARIFLHCNQLFHYSGIC